MKNESTAASSTPEPALAVRAPEKPAAEKRTPNEWAKQAFPEGPRHMPHPHFWQHKAAAALHGWGDHEHHAGEPMQLTGTEYYGALVAVTAPAKDGNYLAHLPALSPHGHVAKQLTAFAASQAR